MRYFLYFLLFQPFVSFQQNGVDEKITEIDSYVMKLNNELEGCDSADDPCGWYKTVIQINEGNQPWRAVGVYTEKITFWYDDQPEFAEEEHGDKNAALHKVSVHVLSTYEMTYDFYYSKGKVVKALHSFLNVDEDRKEEKLLYFENGKIINLKTEATENQSDSETIHQQSAHYQRLFLLTFLNH
ncbi:MAG: hypothetical protein MI810_12700 [Flavobacteriales bacterium]|nr:hypothetical protein [Flavobacteriales bacterium]